MAFDKIYFDMDGVLADFRKGVRDLCGIEAPDQGNSTDVDDERMYDGMRRTDRFYLRLEPIDGMVDLFRELRRLHGDRIEILSAIPKPQRNIVGAGEDKTEWVRRYLDDGVKVNIVLQEEKRDYAKGPGYLLVDDTSKNLREWSEAGGTPFRFYDAEGLRAFLEAEGVLRPGAVRTDLDDGISRGARPVPSYPFTANVLVPICALSEQVRVPMPHALFVLLDGMEDDPNPALGGRKPFEVAEMPFMRSKCPHLNHTRGKGYTQLFLNEFWTGHPPKTPRAALEAAGLGMDISPGRKAFRMSPAFIEDGTVRWAYGVDDRAEDIEKAVRSNLEVLGHRKPDIRFFVHGRSVITMECPEEVPQGPQAPVDGPYVDILPDISDFIAAVADDNGGLTCYPWGIGAPSGIDPCYPQIKDMVSVSNSPTALGVSATLGHGIRFVEDLEDRFPVARDLLEDGPVFLHLDEVDEYSHQKDHMKKIRVLERIDGLMEEYFSDHSNILLFVDHGTSCITGEHILTEVPFRTDCALMGDGERYATADVVPKFMESIQ